MPENQKEKDDGSWAEDQEKRGYYYDDSHGYEDYDPEDEDEKEEEEATTSVLDHRPGAKG